MCRDTIGPFQSTQGQGETQLLVYAHRNVRPALDCQRPVTLKQNIHRNTLEGMGPFAPAANCISRFLIPSPHRLCPHSCMRLGTSMDDTSVAGGRGPKVPSCDVPRRQHSSFSQIASTDQNTAFSGLAPKTSQRFEIPGFQRSTNTFLFPISAKSASIFLCEADKFQATVPAAIVMRCAV